MADKSITGEHAMGVAQGFVIDGTPTYANRINRGHINDTFELGTSKERYILQRIEHNVFEHPVEVMHNIKLALDHIHAKLRAQGEDPRDRALTLVDASNGLHYLVADNGHCWRCYEFMEGEVYDSLPAGAEGLELAKEAARAFGNFQLQLDGLAPLSLYEAIPDFHNQPWRFEEFLGFMEADRADRVAQCQADIDFILTHQYVTELFEEAIASGDMPLAVTHADNKINNICFRGTQARAVFDLDTVGKGYRLHDLGDLLRTATSAGAEDERDLSKVRLDLDMYDAVIAGYMEAVGDILTPTEKTLVVAAGMQLPFEMGMRFLGRHIDGDTYFAVHREGQNLDRARTQLHLVKQMEEHREELQRIVERYI